MLCGTWAATFLHLRQRAWKDTRILHLTLGIEHISCQKCDVNLGSRSETISGCMPTHAVGKCRPFPPRLSLQACAKWTILPNLSTKITIAVCPSRVGGKWVIRSQDTLVLCHLLSSGCNKPAGDWFHYLVLQKRSQLLTQATKIVSSQSVELFLLWRCPAKGESWCKAIILCLKLPTSGTTIILFFCAKRVTFFLMP